MKSIYRPKLKLPLSNFEIVVECACIILLIVLFAGLARTYSNLPESVASHFNIKGVPDSYGGRSSLFVLALVTLGIYVLLTIMRRYPNLYNYPVKITEENARMQYQIARNYIAVLKLSVMLIFAIIEWNIIHLSLGESKTYLQGTSFLVFLTLVLVLPFVYYLMLAKRNK